MFNEYRALPQLLPPLSHPSIVQMPTDPSVHLRHGIALMQTGCFARAAARFRRATMLAPSDPAGWINFSAALLALDQPKAARAAARRALRLAPNHPDATQALARGHVAAGDFDAAIATLHRLLRIAPDRAGGWVDLGSLHARRGDMGQARKAMQAALRADPDCSAAAANLGAFSLLSGEQEAAIAGLRAVLAKDAGCVAARLNLANALLLDRQAAPVLDLLDGPVPPGREGAHWRAHLAMALLLLQRDADAAAVLAQIPRPWGDAEILIVNRNFQLARRRGDAPNTAALSSQLETLSDDRRFLYEHRIVACFDLGRYFHDQHDNARAFTQWRRGHDLLRRLQPFNRPAHQRFIEASITTFSAAAMRTGPRARNNDAAPVFIVGLPRSGTTLTEHILASHSAVHGAGERSALHDLIVKRTGGSLHDGSARQLADVGAADLDAMADVFLRDLHYEALNARYIIDKMPGNALHLGFIARLLPRARIILCTRDPRDVGLSIFRLRFFGHHPYAHDLSDLGFYIAEHERLMTHWRATLPIPILEIALTDWTEDFAATLARALRFLDLPHDPACEKFYENPRRIRTASADQVREPVHRRGLGRWRKYATELAPMLAELHPKEP